VAIVAFYCESHRSTTNSHLAHFLWKRCPYSQREPRLMTLREIALALCREDYETAFSLCRNTDWQELNQLATDFLGK